MQMIVLKIINHRIEFRVFNLFQLNNKFLYEVLTIAFSYIIVLIQYELNV